MADMSMNTSEETPHPDERDSGWAISDIENSLLVRSVYGLIAAIGITGNAIVIFVLIRIPNFRTKTSLFIIHLAVTDFLTCVLIIPFNLFPGSPKLQNNAWGELICRLVISKFPLWATISASVCSLVCVHLERFVAIVYHLKYKRYFTRVRTTRLICGCWVLGAISHSDFFYLFAVEEGQCTIQPWPHRVLRFLDGVYVFSVFFVFPIVFSLGVNMKMISVLKAKAASLGSKGIPLPSVEKGDVKKTADKDIKEAWQLQMAQELSHTLLVVVITFAICWAPNELFIFIYSMGAELPFNTPWYHFTVILSICNSCMNPFIYFFKNETFRSGLKEAISPLCCSKNMRDRWGSLRSGSPVTASTDINTRQQRTNSAQNLEEESALPSENA